MNTDNLNNELTFIKEQVKHVHNGAFVKTKNVLKRRQKFAIYLEIMGIGSRRIKSVKVNCADDIRVSR